MQKLEDLIGNGSVFLDKVYQVIENTIGKSEWENANNILKYPLTPKGHMIRPFLSYITAMSLNSQLSEEIFSRLVYFAASVELLHNASLIHDDVLDHEISRRGKNCLYQEFGETNAILAGNIYYIKAFELILEYQSKHQFKSFLKTASDMCFGEILQKQHEGKEKPVEVYLEIIRMKTSSLMGMSCGEAARLVGADSAVIQQVKDLGEYIGTIYQLQDDFKDGDSGLDEGFDFVQNSLDYMQKAEEIINKLPNKQFSNAFDQFILILRGCLLKNI